MSDGNTYETPIVHAIEGGEGAELIKKVMDESCEGVFCAINDNYSPHDPLPCAMPTEQYCGATASFCSIRFTF